MSTKTDKKITELYLLISGLENSQSFSSTDQNDDYFCDCTMWRNGCGHVDNDTIEVFCDAAYRVLYELKISIAEDSKHEN